MAAARNDASHEYDKAKAIEIVRFIRPPAPAGLDSLLVEPAVFADELATPAAIPTTEPATAVPKQLEQPEEKEGNATGGW